MSQFRSRAIKFKITDHKIVAAIVFLVALVNFIATVAPTTSFWDCGEFIAASYTLGVPHPPGAPLYLLIGRFFSMLPFVENVGFRVNLVSVVVSAITVLLLYLSLVRLIESWRGAAENLRDKMTVYGSAAIGALAFAFSHSFWFNAVEAEVYSMSMFFTALVFYLSLRWLDYADEPFGNRIILLIFYIIGLSSGVHLLNILVLMSFAYIIAARKMEELTLKRFIVTGLIGSAVIFSIYPGIIQGVPSIIKSFSIWTFLAILGGLGYVCYWSLKNGRRIIGMISLSSLLVIIGYSTYMLVKIRSGLDPFLDENNPETWAGLLSYLNREQYGSESLFLTMFDRHAPFWTYQIKKMYIRYLSWQYFDFNKFYALPFLLGLYGAIYQFYKDAKSAFPVFVLFMMTGFAIVLYLNQDDPQPRERDYAYVGSYYAFAIWIGIGVTALMDTFARSIKALKPEHAIGAIGVLCFFMVPFNMWVRNYHEHDRSGNYVAWDYAYNLLSTCEPDAILYTNGDNDTFPLWYMQAVEGIRTDVRVANLSLLNTGWFIKQIRDKYPQVPMPARITDSYIDYNIDSRDISGLSDRRWEQVRKVSVAGKTPFSPKMTWDVPATLSYPVGAGGQSMHFLRVQDFMILNTIVANKWERPIQFAVTCPDGNLLGLRDVRDPSKNYLTMDGLTFLLHPEPSPMWDAQRMADNLLRRYQYRNANNPSVFFNDSQLKLLGNYRQAFIQLAYYYYTESTNTGNVDTTGMSIPLEERVKGFESLPPRVKALTVMDFMGDRIPEDVVDVKMDVITMQIGRLYTLLGKPEEMKIRLDRLTADPQRLADPATYAIYYLNEANAPERAKDLFNAALQQNSTFDNHFQIASTWLQLSKDTSYPTELFLRYMEIDRSRQAKLRVAEQGKRLGLYQVAETAYVSLMSESPEDVSIVRGLVDLYRKTGENRKALGLLNDWIGGHPTDREMKKIRDEISVAEGTDF